MKRIPLWAAGVGVVLAGALAAGGLAAWNAQRAKAVSYVTAAVDRGPISRTITASGTVNPVVTVQVGAFVSGTIQSLTCDYNTRVRKGQPCAKIDPRPYETTVAQASANVDTAKAQLGKDQAGLAYAQLSHGRSLELLRRGFLSPAAGDLTRSARDQALAQTRVSAAVIRQREAELHAAQVNLNYTTIVSPVDGTVVSRNVNVGQTVAASFQTPTLFLIATDLTKMQVDTNVSESDIGGAMAGDRATFTVSAYPGRTFRGRVTQVRQAPISVQNVITYDVVIAADNPDLLLKPGMTATARIVVAERQNVLRAPLQALSFTPATTATARQGRPSPAGGQQPQHVWVLEDGQARRAPVNVGLDDDVNAEITGGALRPGDRVIVSANRNGQAGRARPPATVTPRLGL
ncbi:MAG: efflux RND transporter periplasmic adaptor subunit [Phenylobacterium sp.]